MSRSFKRNPYIGSEARTSKQYKVAAHRALRRMARVCLLHERELPHDKQYGDPWTSPNDYKPFWNDPRGYRK